MAKKPKDDITNQETVPATEMREESFNDKVKSDKLKPGYVLNNRFEIKEHLGRGGMGVVYHAWDRELKQDVAVKLIREELISIKIIERMKRELKLARKIGHRNIARVYDIGDHQGFKYISMELIEGKSLRELISEKSRINPDEFLIYARQITEALDAAHEESIIHRDLKPGNIMVDDKGRIKLLDFGLAFSPEEERITHMDAVMGTMEYVSPEQARGQTPTAKSDIYSLGVIFFNMLTGKLPFQGETPLATAMKHVEEKTPAPSSFVRDIPPILERIILKCMQKVPEDRYENCAELLADLKKAETSSGVRSLKILRFGKARRAAAAVLFFAVAVMAYMFIPWGDKTISDELAMEVDVIGERLDLAGNPVEVIVKNGETLFSNDGFQIHVTPEREGYLYAFIYDSSGKVEILFPRIGIARDNFIEAHREVVLPDKGQWYRLDDNTGVENLYVLFSEDKFKQMQEFMDEIKSSGPETEIKPEYDFMSDLKKYERGVKSVDTGRTKKYFLGDGRFIEKESEVLKGKDVILKSVSFLHK